MDILILPNYVSRTTVLDYAKRGGNSEILSMIKKEIKRKKEKRLILMLVGMASIIGGVFLVK